MLTVKRTNPSDPDFIQLVTQLDADLAVRDGTEHSFYDQFNKTDSIRHAVVAFYHEVPVSCGAVKHFSADTMEVKRMFTLPEYRGRGIAVMVLKALEEWAAEMNYRYCILETGKKQPEAIRLYMKSGYQSIPNYGPYAGVANSVCFSKSLVPAGDGGM